VKAMAACLAVLVAAAGLTLALPVLVGLVAVPPALDTPSALALRDIPAGDLAILEQAAAQCPGLSWTVLAGIAKVESDLGRSTLPGVHSGANPSGAEGPFQFLPATWARYGDGNPQDVYDFGAAAFAAARLLCADGAGDLARLPQAIYQYNHDRGYVAQVLGWAAAYAAGAQVAAGEQAIPGALQGAVGAIRVLGTRVVPLFPWVPQGGFPDPFPWGQCTYYAAFQHRVSWNGNAADWWANAKVAGAAESRVPSLGAIAVWRAGGAYGVYGHVGVVVAVASDRFTVAEMNDVGLGVVDQRVDSLSDPDLLGFIT
jgi:hypothetical protein